MDLKNQYHFYYPEELSDFLSLEEETAFQIQKVLRLKEGDFIALLDGKGKKAIYQIQKIEKNSVRIHKMKLLTREKQKEISLVFGALKKEKTEWILEKSTELGVSQIFIFESSYSKIKIEEMINKKNRFLKIMQEALEQSDNYYLPQLFFLSDLFSLEQYLSHSSTLIGLDKNQPKITLPTSFSQLFLVVGPEGGLHPTEIEWLRQKNTFFYSLSDHILKTETACIAAISYYTINC